eukprot:TRINITY_DN3688_c3_g1_i1.p1 TRINITY_DN3688_c3_g1~~TRINITY_DN3688_c3_g1_i1.p1  ORF type:complete len:258 (-),score=48.21 TRINITY_DN3688_c3_g1_i1:572-1345(-)
MEHENSITLPALGHDVQLGMMYNARTGELFAGVSVWDNSSVNRTEETKDHQIQDAEYEYSMSRKEAREKAGLSPEGSLSLDLGLLEAKGSAKYLSDKQTSEFEARVDVSCTVARRTRRIPQETLSSMPYESRLDDERFTHFVAEVVEGGTATLSFVQNCNSAEELKEVSGKLEVKLKTLPIGGSADVHFKDETESESEKVKISYSGAMAESVLTFHDARRVAKLMPTKLKQQMNTLSYKLLPVSLLKCDVRRLVREG